MGRIFGPKKIQVNTCIECDAPCKVAKVVKTKWAKQQGIMTGMVWVCNNGHTCREHKQEIK